MTTLALNVIRYFGRIAWTLMILLGLLMYAHILPGQAKPWHSIVLMAVGLCLLAIDIAFFKPMTREETKDTVAEYIDAIFFLIVLILPAVGPSVIIIGLFMLGIGLTGVPTQIFYGMIAIGVGVILVHISKRIQ